MKFQHIRLGLFTGVLLVALLFTALPAKPAQAASIAELEAQIQVLIAKVAELQQLLATRNNASCPNFTNDLWVGKSGAEVTQLQNYLISKGHAIPAGATGYFGEQTKAALSQFQNANGLAPASGIFGIMTRNKIKNMCQVTIPTAPTIPTTPTKPTDTLSGGADLERFKATDGDDTDIEEGDRHAEVMTVSFRVRWGDALLQRITIGVEPDASNDETDPWDTFDSFTIKMDGATLATIDAGREKNWREDDPNGGQYSIRISNLDEVLHEDDEVELTIETSVQNSIKGTQNGELWSIFIPDDGIRTLDADKVVLTIGDTADATTLNIDQAGSSDELLVRRSDSDPDAHALRLEDDRRSDWVEVFAFDIDTDDSRRDIEVREIPIAFTLSTSTLNELVRAARITIGGETYTDETITDNTITFNFDRNELVIDNGDRVIATVELEFNELPIEHEGTLLSATVHAEDIHARGEDKLTLDQLAGSATSETHTLITHGIEMATPTITSAVVTSVKNHDDYITLTLSAPVTAYNQSVYIPTDGSSISYELVNTNDDTLPGLGSMYVSSDAKKRNGYFFIPKDSTRDLTMTVTYVPGISTFVRLQLISVGFNSGEAAPNQTWSAEPLDRYQTDTKMVLY